jgi:AcrR family transcriptional regulator
MVSALRSPVNERWPTLVGMSSSPPRRSDATRAAILRAARERFAADGYERATIRAIAADARIDPAMVMRYYGSKEKLFTVAAEFDLLLPDVAHLPREQIGERLISHFLDRWEGDDSLVALLRAAATNEAAAERMHAIFADQLCRVVADLLPPGAPAAEAAERAGLVASQILGMALCRYILRLPPVVAMDRAAVVDWIGPTLQRYLSSRSSGGGSSTPQPGDPARLPPLPGEPTPQRRDRS